MVETTNGYEPLARRVRGVYRVYCTCASMSDSASAINSQKKNINDNKDRLPPIIIAGCLENVSDLKKDVLDILNHSNFIIASYLSNTRVILFSKNHTKVMQYFSRNYLVPGLDIKSIIALKSKNGLSFSYVVTFPHNINLDQISQIDTILNYQARREKYVRKTNYSQCHR